MNILYAHTVQLYTDGQTYKHLYCIIFIHFYSASLSRSEALPTTALTLCRS